MLRWDDKMKNNPNIGKRRILLTALLVIGVFINCFPVFAEESICGDGVCDLREIAEKDCDADCDYDKPVEVKESSCGDGVCDKYEAESRMCEPDCGKYYESEEKMRLATICGDGVCEWEESLKDSCPQDCISGFAGDESGHNKDCGDNVCEMYEAAKGTCPQDCSDAPTLINCGDGTCDEHEAAYKSCPQDCPGMEKSLEVGTGSKVSNFIMVSVALLAVIVTLSIIIHKLKKNRV